MAPLLNIKVHLKNLSSSIRSQFASRGGTPGSSDTKTNRGQYNCDFDGLKLRPDGAGTMVSGASAKRSAGADQDDDLVPLHSTVGPLYNETRKSHWSFRYIEDFVIMKIR